MKHIAGRTALLTGASGGIGAKIAAALADAGANVVLTGRREDALTAVAAAVTERGTKAAVVPADLSNFDSFDGLVRAAEDALGPIDLLVNNAGIEAIGPLVTFPPEEFKSIIDVNLVSPALLTQRVLPGMLERGRGHVVFVASGVGRFPPAYASAYAASKAGLIALTQSLRAEHLHSPVGFSVVSPGYVAGDGMYQRVIDTGVRSSKLIGRTTTEKVAASVVRAIRQDSVERLPTGAPARPLMAMGALAPKFVERLADRMGMNDFFREAARERGRL